MSVTPLELAAVAICNKYTSGDLAGWVMREWVSMIEWQIDKAGMMGGWR